MIFKKFNIQILQKLTLEITIFNSKIYYFQYQFSFNYFNFCEKLFSENLVKESSIVNSNNEESTSERQNIETYAKITARRKSVYLKRLHNFSKPMKKPLEPGFGSYNSENNFTQLLKKFPGKKNL